MTIVPVRRVELCSGTALLLASVCGLVAACGDPARSAPGTIPVDAATQQALVPHAKTSAASNELHGAAPTAEQEKAYDALVPMVEFGPPPGVDPEIWESLIPANNAMTAARVALGRRLYFEKRLSSDGTVSCSTCHDPTRAFGDGRPVAEGVRGQLGRRNSPTTLNAALLQSQFWDARAGNLEEQAMLPILNPLEMDMPNDEAAVAAIAADPTYEPMFQAAYRRPVNYPDIARALAAFQRTFIFLDASFDRFAAGDASAMSESAQRGWVLFNGKARCVTCHPMSRANPTGSDGRFHNIGVSARHKDFEELAKKALISLGHNPNIHTIEELALGTDASELGRFVVSRNFNDVGAFRTPQIRNVGITAPYMHDGSLQTLWDVMDHYNKGGEANPYLDGGMEPLALTEAELQDMVTFLFALTDVRLKAANDRAFDAQKTRMQKNRPFRDDDLAHRRRLAFEPQRGTP